MRVELLLVDIQNDFCIADDGQGNKGALVVPGADKDTSRLVAMIKRLGAKIDDIHVTLDSHQGIGIERPHWWKRCSDGTHPAPFTILGIHPDGRRIVKFTADAAGLHPTDEEYTTTLPSMLHHGGPTGKGSFGYLQALQAGGKYPHVIWPVHCCVGSWGHSLVPELSDALIAWEQTEFAKVDYVTKGNNPWTEHFSGIAAEVPDPSDPTTQVNTQLIQALERADIIVIAGQARSHCVNSSVRGVASCFSDPKYIEKLVLLTDCTSDVPGFEFMGEAFVKEMTAKGMKLSTSDKFLA
jgi:nicotinamidase-related amidase